MVQNVLPFDVKPIPAMNWPDSEVTLFGGLFLKGVKNNNLKLVHNIATGLKIVLLNLHRYFFISCEVIEFFAKTVFYKFYIHF